MKRHWKKILVAALIVAAVIIVRALDVGQYLNIETLNRSRTDLLALKDRHYLLFVAAFILVYILSVALSVPWGAYLTIAGGFLFGMAGVIYVNIGATAGAAAAFLASRYLIGDAIQEKYREKLTSFNAEIERNGRNYMLTLRLIPIFPFFLINILAGVTRIPLSTFVWTTSLGIIPGSFVYTYAGTQLAWIRNADDIMNWKILLALALFGLLALLPVIIKKIRRQ